MAARTLPSQEFLRDCLDYDPDTGLLRWKFRPEEHFNEYRMWRWWNSAFAGKVAGQKPPEMYVVIVLDRQKWYGHRLIYKMMTGADPIEVDHIDGNKRNNQWSNLREATHQENICNKIGSRNSKHYKGIYKAHGKWIASITVNYKSHHLGCFDTPEEAYAVYCEAALRLHGRFFNPGH